jgi:hypothetical protein
MNVSLWQRCRPHAIAIGIFFLASVLYCLPAFQGLVVSQHDLQGWKGMAQQSIEFKETYGYYPLWTQSTFSGMPAFQILVGSKLNITLAHLHHLFVLFLPSPAGLFFLACTGFYILCMALRINVWVAILGSIAYAFASYNAVLVSVGHTSKFSTMGYAPALLAGLVLLSERKYLLGFVTTLLFGTLMTYQNHVQILYYTFLIAFCFGVAFIIRTFRTRDFVHFGKTAGLALAALIMSVLSYAVVLFPTYDYAKETMRGGRSELGNPSDANNQNKTKGGLNKDYAFGYSYGITEVLTIASARMYGGSTPRVIDNQYVGEFPEETRTAEVLSERTGMPSDQANQFVNQLSSYWGEQSPTSGAVYFGAVICALFVAGLFLYNGPHKGWLIAATVLGIFLAWGKNFSAFNYFLFDHLPFYNKFRAPSMALVIPQLTMPLLAVLGLDQFLKTDKERVPEKRFQFAMYGIAALLGLLILMYFMLDFRSPTDPQMRESLANSMAQQMAQGAQPSPEMQQQGQDFARAVTNALKDDRQSLYGSDLVRSTIFIVLAAGLLFAYQKRKLAAVPVAIAFCILGLIDLIGVDLRYLSARNYVEPQQFEDVFVANRADLQIQQDTSYYRVFDQTEEGGAFALSASSSRTSYFHNNVGGYHPAKLALYDDLMKEQLAKGNLQVYNMLNTKYFIVPNPADRQPVAQQNDGALGPAWLVSNIRYVNNANEEMRALDVFNPRDTAIIDVREKGKVTVTPTRDSAATIRFVKNLNDRLTYTFSSQSDQFAVFSEIYYPRGWQAFIDGKEAPIARVNYVLRGLSIPKGNHTIEFKFEPASYIWGDRISNFIGIVSIMIMLAAAFLMYKKDRQSKTRQPNPAKKENG